MDYRYEFMKTPSELPVFGTESKTSQALTVEQIHRKIELFGQVIKKLQAAGFDGVEIHAMHWGYLLDDGLCGGKERKNSR